MRILHLVRIFGFGGAENHVRDLANVIDEMGHEVFIMAGKIAGIPVVATVHWHTQYDVLKK